MKWSSTGLVSASSFNLRAGIRSLELHIKGWIHRPQDHSVLPIHYTNLKFHLTFDSGKTFLAKAIAGSVTNATFIEIKMSNILSSFRGTSEQTATAIFDVGEIFGPSIIYMGKTDWWGVTNFMFIWVSYPSYWKVKNNGHTQLSYSNKIYIIFLLISLIWLIYYKH